MRDKTLDFLKSIGLVCIIMAHVLPPTFIFQLRNFDVILMIIVSCILFLRRNTSFDRTLKDNCKYLKKRFSRLVIPTWIFLIVYFSIFILMTKKIDFDLILSSFLLYEGIGYVWIIRIYLLIAIMLPIVIKKINKKNYLTLLILIFIHEVACSLGLYDNKLLDYFISYLIPCYIIIFVSGWLINNSNKKICIFSIINLFLFIIIAFFLYLKYGKFIDTNYMKYPFRIYYLSYAFFVSGFLLILSKNNKIVRWINKSKIIDFLSKNSLWIYLWHILVLSCVNYTMININWVLKFLITVLGTSIIVIIQKYLINILEKKGINKKFLEVFKG